MKARICVVAANYYPKITKDLLSGVYKVLRQHNIKNYKLIYSPGAFEIPVIISKNIKKFDAFIALGCIIKGKTVHFNLISKACTNAIMFLSIANKIPISNGIIACNNINQAMIRSNPQKKNKGGEAARAVLKVLKISRK